MAVKASERVKRYQNPNGPTISTVERKVIEQDGLYFKDIDGTGTVSAVNDWRLTPAERAEAYVKVLTTSEKIGQIFTSDWRMGPKYPSPRLAANGHKPVADESGLLDEAPVNVSDSIFGSQSLPSTSDMVKKSFNRHVILRESPTPEDLADYLNQLQYLTETCDHFVPMQVMSNSRNENGEVVFGMNDATGVFATYPGTLGIAAAVKGTARIDIIDKFADTIRREWNACGLKKGYMYMADCVTDPRWQRTFGTFGEDPELIEEIFDHLIPGIQGGSNGVTPEGVSMTVKHFPGGGARENGFDPLCSRPVEHLRHPRLPAEVPHPGIPRRHPPQCRVHHALLLQAQRREERSAGGLQRQPHRAPALRLCLQQGVHRRPAARPDGLQGLHQLRHRHCPQHVLGR